MSLDGRLAAAGGTTLGLSDFSPPGRLGELHVSTSS